MLVFERQDLVFVINLHPCWEAQVGFGNTLQGTNISPSKVAGKMIFPCFLLP